MRKSFVAVVAALVLVTGVGACSRVSEDNATPVTGVAKSVDAPSEPVEEHASVEAFEPESEPAAEPVPDYEALAGAVIRGEYGNAAERRERLGVDYDAVQAIVDSRMASVVSDPVAAPDPVVYSASVMTQTAPVESQPTAVEPSVPDVTGIPACVNEDGSTADGYQPTCYWDASSRGNGVVCAG